VTAVRRLVPILALCVLALSAFCASAGAARFYMPSYSSGPPEVIGGFDLGSDGSLTTLPGSPFVAEGSGIAGVVGLGFTPDGSRAASAFLFAGGIQGYAVSPGGALSLTNTLTGAEETGIAISPDGHFAFAPTRGSGAEGITRFSIAGDGTLTRLEPPTGTGESWGVAVTPDGRFLYTIDSGAIAGFAIGSGGGLASLGSSGPSAKYLGVSPDGRFLFDVFNDGVRTLAIAPDGSLTPVGAPLLLGASTPTLGYFGIAPDGSHLYVPDFNNEGRIYSVAIAADGSPTLAGEIAAEKPESVSASPDGRYLVYFKPDGGYAIGVVAVGPGGSLSRLPSTVAFGTAEPEPLVFQPQPTPVARFSATIGIAGAATTFDAGASERAARYEWSFGDGATAADGGPTPTHVYASPGTYQVSLVVTDAQGCSVRQVYTGQSTVCPGGEAARTVGSVVVSPSGSHNAKPVLRKVQAVPRTFAPKVYGVKPGKVKLGTTFHFKVSEPASVRFKFESKQGKRFKKLGSRATKPGAKKLRWNGKLKGKPLRPGHYRATVIATDKEGARSAPKTVGFRILSVPPPR
jgi:PKD repeat protein